MAEQRALTTAVIADVERERIRQVDKYPLERDRQLGGVHQLVVLAGQRSRGPGCGYYHRKGLVEAAAILVAAIELLDTSTDTGSHDERACKD